MAKCGVGHDLGHGVGHGLLYGLSYGPPYGLPVVNFVTTRLSIAVNLCKQRAPSICHIYVLLVVFCSNFRVWTKRGVGHGLPYGLPVVIFLKLGSSLLLTCVNNMPHESVIDSLLSFWQHLAQIFYTDSW